MREVFPGHHVACHLREVQTAAFTRQQRTFRIRAVPLASG